ncbi:lipoprotein insertase outer membrane protein LolB [Endozoicomonas sp. SCSIO W0465]|uniref:lipoprotein insertase outer membrane protein LolB n=1 Tax=Endozoicomonas sp. SCSIO W0465 TaxID=2918516 RepID=UPI0020756A41|nr:lipoprotein insertase outer membrane protein LolB [Endozoicomonas sp. SCSIO W0465]USE35146.1 lipoprotein insertase outer membrane protein LolB [Endozoicomonas sp. SCSIO W0465]
MGVDKYFSGLRILLVLSFLILSGCASRTVDSGSQVSDEEKEQRWQRHQERLGQIKSWEMTGRLNMRVPGQSGTMSLDWRQRGDEYMLFLDGPLGVSVASVSGNRQGVSVTASDETRYGPSPEMLLYSLTGWQFPVSNLRYWIRGLPAPGSNALIQLNNLGYPEKIEQQGWMVVYQKYGLGSSQRLPAQLIVSRGNVQLSLVINNWQL